MWFSYVTGPNGVSIRILYTAIVDIGERSYLEILREVFGERFGVEILCSEDLSDLYKIARLDPDILDAIREKKLCALVISAGAKAMGSK